LRKQFCLTPGDALKSFASQMLGFRKSEDVLSLKFQQGINIKQLRKIVRHGWISFKNFAGYDLCLLTVEAMTASVKAGAAFCRSSVSRRLRP
jgi:hypothetical protein